MPNNAIVEKCKKFIPVFPVLEYSSRVAILETPLIYPSGSNVILAVEERKNGSFFVSDDGGTFIEADDMGFDKAGYCKRAKNIATEYGCFINGVDICSEINFEKAAVRAKILANCCLRTSYALEMSEPKTDKPKKSNEIAGRLKKIFGDDPVSENVTINGSSSHEWVFDALVNISRKKTIFDCVTNDHNSIASAFTKFSDVRASETGENLVSIVPNEFIGTDYASLLSKTCNIVPYSAADSSIREIAVAA